MIRMLAVGNNTNRTRNDSNNQDMDYSNDNQNIDRIMDFSQKIETWIIVQSTNHNVELYMIITT